MLMQTDLFAPEVASDDCAALVVVRGSATQIAVPCGFRDRNNNQCHRKGNWAIMDGAKQMLCRDRPMVHCDPACFRGEAPPLAHDTGDDDVLWGDQEEEYGDDQ